MIFGGYSATYFHEELIEKPEVDFVLRGDSTEEPLRMLLDTIVNKKDGDYGRIPNLVWKNKDGETAANPFTNVPDSLDHYKNNYGHMIRSAIRYRDIRGMLPIHDWWSYPICAVMTCRGCKHACSFCGGSNPSLKLYANRHKPAFRSPEMIVRDILQIGRITSAPVFVVGDLRQGGDDYADAILDGLRGKKLKNHVILELFNRAPESYFKKLDEVFPHYNLEISPESHDIEVRRASGKTYTNEQLEGTIQAALDNGCEKLDVFFMMGLPNQTSDSVLKTVDYCEFLMAKFGADRLIPFISPLAPFIDPGCPLFEESEKYGYTIFSRTLEDFRTAFLNPSWKQALSYETRWMSRDRIVDVTYEAALRMNSLKRRFGQIDEAVGRDVDERIRLAKRIIGQIDEVIDLPEAERERALEAMRPDIDRVNAGTLCEVDEIKWPVLSGNFHFFKIALGLLRG